LKSVTGLVSLGDKDFYRLSTYIMSHYGIKLPPAKKTLVQCRLQKRLKAYNMCSFSDYIDFLFSPAGRATELSHMIDEISTNKTDFFREPKHFDYLTQTGLKDFCLECRMFKRGRALYNRHDPERICKAAAIYRFHRYRHGYFNPDDSNRYSGHL
jgi:hypothetical protein